jgi:hypothetical protein
MAFRGYELNLILRVQDRATTRLRRLSQDIGGLSRASELQRQSARIAQTRSRNMMQLTRAQAALESRTAAIGQKNLSNQSQLLRARANEIQLQQRLNGLSARNPALRQATMMRLQAVQKDILRLQTLQVTEQAQLNATIAESVALEKTLAREAEVVAAAQARAQRLENFQRRARLATHAGSVAMMAGGIGLVASAGFANRFAEFNRLSTAAATQLRGVNAPLSDISRITGVVQTAMLNMTREFPASAEEMSQSLYDIASGMDFVNKRGQPLESTIERFDQSAKLLKLANQAAVAGNVDLGTATEALITVLNNFDPALKNPTQRLEQLFAIVRFGKGTFAQFAPQFGRMAAAANAAGQNLNEAGGAVAFLSQRLSQSQAVTAYTRLLQIMNRREFRAGFESIFKIPATLGKGANERLRQLSDIIGIIATRAPGLRKGGTTLATLIQTITARGQDVLTGKPGHTGLVSTENARIGITNLVKFTDQYSNTLNNVKSDTNEWSASFAAAMKQPGVQWQIAINQFKALAIVIGQDAIPHILRFVDWVGQLGHKYEELSPKTRRLIGMFTTWGSAILFLGGAFVTIVGGIGILIGRLGGLMGILGGTAGAGLIGRMGNLLRIVSRLAAIGAIAIIIKTGWSGDASAKDFLMGALMGGVAGAQIGGSAAGPWGALAGFAAGAITVPVAMEVAPHLVSHGSDAQKKLSAQFNADMTRRRRAGETLISFDQFRNQKMNDFVNSQNFNKLDKQFGFGAFVTNQKNRIQDLNKASGEGTQSILQKWQGLAAQMTGIDLFGHMSQDMAKTASLIGLNLAKAMASGNEGAIRKAIQAKIAQDRTQIARLEKLPKTAENIKALTQLYADIGQLTGQLTSMNKQSAAAQEKATREAAKHRREIERQQRAQERANTAYDNAVRRVEQLKLKFKQLREQEVEKLRGVFGDIFQGPLMQGPIGQAFTGIANTLSGFGQTFPIPAQMILNDQKAQQKQFDTLISDLNMLQKRGLQPKAIQNILSQGPSALPFLEGLRKAGPGAQNQFIKNVNARSKSILEAMQTPFEKQITASNTQLAAARLQMKAAKARLDETKKRKNNPTGSKSVTKPVPTRTTQSVTHHHNTGDTVTVHADGATPATVKKAFDRHAFDKRHRR